MEDLQEAKFRIFVNNVFRGTTFEQKDPATLEHIKEQLMTHFRSAQGSYRERVQRVVDVISLGQQVMETEQQNVPEGYARIPEDTPYKRAINWFRADVLRRWREELDEHPGPDKR